MKYIDEITGLETCTEAYNQSGQEYLVVSPANPGVAYSIHKSKAEAHAYIHWHLQRQYPDTPFEVIKP